MVGRRSAKDTAKLIDEVARGDRLLEDIKDPQLRETVRLALRLHKDPYTAPDARTRSRIRARVLFGLHPHNATLIDRLTHHVDLMVIEGQSYRLRESEQETAARRTRLHSKKASPTKG